MNSACDRNRSSSTWKCLGYLIAFGFILVVSLSLSSCRKKPEIRNSPELCSAAYRGDDVLARTLLQNGADVNSRDLNGCTPITEAVGGGHLSTVKLLIEKGGDLNAPCASGANPLFIAASRGHEDIVRLLLDKGADFNRADAMGGSALTYAINEGHTGIVRTLINRGAEVNGRLTYGETPLILAVKRDNEAAVRMLLDDGATVRVADHNSESPLHYAIERGNTGIAQLLIEKGADVNLRAGDGFTPLHLARSKKLDKIVTLLLAAGAREPQDSFQTAAAEYREKQEKSRREIENRGLEFIVTDHDVQFYVKPDSIRSTGSDTCQATVWEYRFDSGELEEIGMEVNCAERTYRHLSNALLDLAGNVLQVIPVDSYVLNDNGTIRDGTSMHRIMTRVCGSR
jgi:ankyrin repeat protein